MMASRYHKTLPRQTWRRQNTTGLVHDINMMALGHHHGIAMTSP
jgi:hypothetical protein